MFALQIIHTPILNVSLCSVYTYLILILVFVVCHTNIVVWPLRYRSHVVRKVPYRGLWALMVVWWPYVCLVFRGCGFTSGGQGSGCVFSEESFPSMLQDNRSWVKGPLYSCLLIIRLPSRNRTLNQATKPVGIFLIIPLFFTWIFICSFTLISLMFY